ncbi:MAG TPA: hypothetical protein VIP05_29570, partial [Burkholderiaceae bacterium]
RLLARGGSPAARLLLGLGPLAHWTSVAAATGGFVAFAGVAIAGLALTPYASVVPAVLGGLGYGLVYALVIPALQVDAKLYQTRREQALLVLLPGVPRGARLSRTLALRLGAQVGATWLAAFALMRAFTALAGAMSGGEVGADVSNWATALAFGLLPFLPLVWRPWAAMREPGHLRMTLASLGSVLLAFAATGLQRGLGWPLDAIGAGYALVMVAGCAWRWRAMAGEAQALPVGRLAA